MRSTTSSEFVEWRHYLERAWNVKEKEEHYLARIAFEVARGNAKNPKAVQFEDFLFSFTHGDRPKSERRQTVDESKAIWCALLGVKAE